MPYTESLQSHELPPLIFPFLVSCFSGVVTVMIKLPIATYQFEHMCSLICRGSHTVLDNIHELAPNEKDNNGTRKKNNEVVLL